MDSDTVCFQDLNLKQKLFEEELQHFIKIGNESETKRVLNVVPFNKKELDLKNITELSNEAKQQQAKEFALLKEQNEYSKHIADISTKIEAMEETLQKLQDEVSIGKDELKQMKKPLLKAIKKYSKNFNLDLKVKKPETESFIASVKFFNVKDSNSVDFLIDRTNRRILDFSAEWLLSKEEIQELRNTAQAESGLNAELVLSKLRDSL